MYRPKYSKASSKGVHPIIDEFLLKHQFLEPNTDVDIHLV